MICFLFCALPQATSSDFCQNVRNDVIKFQHLTKDELLHLQRPRKEAMISLTYKYHRLCPVAVVRVKAK